jgi:PAS domain S-box-containing protein
MKQKGRAAPARGKARRPGRSASTRRPGRSTSARRSGASRRTWPATPAAAIVLGPLLDLSHDLAWARSESELCAAVARALDALFPGASHAVRLVDPRTLALTAFRARGRLRAQGRERLVLRRAALEAEGLATGPLESAGVALAEDDEPLFEGSAAVAAAPLVVAGALHGVVNVEYEPGHAAPAGAALPLRQLANLAALGVRNLRAIDELASLKTYLEELIEHANAPIAVVNRDKQVTVWNGALVRLTGLGRAGALGQALRDFATPEAAPGLEAVLDRTLAGVPVDGHETRLVVAGGGEARVAFNTAPVRGASGDVDGVVAIGQDLTRLRHLEAAAEQAEKMAGLGRLAAGIVHELNNPLVAVTMYAEALYEKWAFASGAAADLEKIKAIKDAGQRIQKLTRDLTAYARGNDSRPEAVDLGPLLDQAARMCKPALKETSATVEREFGEVPQVEASRAALVQCFVNLITNAAQAIRPGGGTIRLGLGAAGGMVVATVADDGAGMAPEVVARAFEPFYTTRPGRGIGLGLATARGIVARHGGRIDVESAPGKGCTVTVSLPAKAPAGRPPPG